MKIQLKILRNDEEIYFIFQPGTFLEKEVYKIGDIFVHQEWIAISGDYATLEELLTHKYPFVRELAKVGIEEDNSRLLHETWARSK